jgi:hypothetical protein
MKGKLPLVVALAVASLAVGVPAAIAEPGLTGAPEIGETPAPDWFERASAAAERDAAPAPYVDAFERPDPTSFQTATSSTESGTDIAWSQIGIAFGVGLLLALGLAIALSHRPRRPLAQ